MQDESRGGAVAVLGGVEQVHVQVVAGEPNAERAAPFPIDAASGGDGVAPAGREEAGGSHRGAGGPAHDVSEGTEVAAEGRDLRSAEEHVLMYAHFRDCRRADRNRHTGDRERIPSIVAAAVANEREPGTIAEALDGGFPSEKIGAVRVAIVGVGVGAAREDSVFRILSGGPASECKKKKKDRGAFQHKKEPSWITAQHCPATKA